MHGQRGKPANAAWVAEQVAEAQAAGRKALYRINRDVSLSRAIGDFDLRPFGVSAHPDVTVYQLPPGGGGFDEGAAAEAAAADGGGGGGQRRAAVLVLATDGVWDVLDPSAVAALVDRSAHLRDGPGLAGGGAVAQEAVDCVAEMLVAAAKGVEKNNDDVTAVVAAFGLS